MTNIKTKKLRDIARNAIKEAFDKQGIEIITKERPFENGSVIAIGGVGNAQRGNRAKYLICYSDLYQCFVEYDGNKESEDRYRYFILDEDDERIYIEKPKEE